MENSRTLKAGDRIAHWAGERETLECAYFITKKTLEVANTKPEPSTHPSSQGVLIKPQEEEQEQND